MKKYIISAYSPTFHGDQRPAKKREEEHAATSLIMHGEKSLMCDPGPYNARVNAACEIFYKKEFQTYEEAEKFVNYKCGDGFERSMVFLIQDTEKGQYNVKAKCASVKHC